MKTLIIHPKDNTTDFLCDIYKDLHCTIINTQVSKSALKETIKNHDRIVMLGHGDEYGLYGFGTYVITSQLVYLLREKECVAIWCNADVFFKKYSLTGIFSGMIISEYEEAMLCCLHDFKQSDIDKSNQLFAYAVGQSILGKDCVDKFKSLYVCENNPIVMFNKLNYDVTSGSAFA